MNGRLPFLDHASDLLLQLYPICLVLLFPHELIKRPLLIALHVPGHDHLRRACGLGHCVMAAPVPLRSFFSSAAAGKRSPLIAVTSFPSQARARPLGAWLTLALFFLPRKNCPKRLSGDPSTDVPDCPLAKELSGDPSTDVPGRPLRRARSPASEMGTGNSALAARN